MYSVGTPILTSSMGCHENNIFSHSLNSFVLNFLVLHKGFLINNLAPMKICPGNAQYPKSAQTMLALLSKYTVY